MVYPITESYINKIIMINLINMNKTETKKIRTVKVNERGQIVIPEDIRKDFGIKKSSVLVMIEGTQEIILRKESDILNDINDEEVFWRNLSTESMKIAWDKEDSVWDEIFKNEKRWINKT